MALLLKDPAGLLLALCVYTSEGGNLIDWAEAHKVPFGELAAWIAADKERHAQWYRAENMRIEYASARILREVESIAHASARDIFTEDGRLRPVSEWPAAAARFVVNVEVKESRDPVNRSLIVTTTKVKLADKLRALEMLGGEIAGLFKRKVEVSGTVSIANGLASARKRIRSYTSPETSPELLPQGGGGGDFDAGPPPPTPLAKNISVSQETIVEVIGEDGIGSGKVVDVEHEAVPVRRRSARKAARQEDPSDQF